MSDISKVRTLIGDPFVYDRSEAEGDGSSVEFNLPQFPVKPDSATVYIAGSTQTEGADYTLQDEIGLLVIASAPGSGIQVVTTYQWSLLTDTQIQDMLDLNDSNIRLAAADCLDSIASIQALIQKKIKALDLQTDGPALADSLHKLADQWRKMELDSTYQEGDIDIVEQINDTPQYVEAIWKSYLREG